MNIMNIRSEVGSDLERDVGGTTSVVLHVHVFNEGRWENVQISENSESQLHLT